MASERKVELDAPFELVDQQRCTFRSSPLVSHRILDFHLIQDGSVIKCDKKCVPDRPFQGVVVINAKLLVFNTEDFSAEGVDAGIGGGRICAVQGKIGSV